jgi:hypothetical protein
MNFEERINFIMIKAHSQLDQQIGGRKWVDVPFVHEFIDALADVVKKYGSEYDRYLEDREAKKRMLSGAKDIPVDAKQSYEAQKMRIQQNSLRAQHGVNRNYD